MRTAVICRQRRRLWRCRSVLAPSGPSIRAYKGSGNPGGGRSNHGLDTSCQAPPSPWREMSRFFGGSGTGPSRGAFPFSSAENRRIGAIGEGRSKDEEEDEE